MPRRCRGLASTLRAVGQEAAYWSISRLTLTTECPACEQRTEVVHVHLAMLARRAANPEVLAAWGFGPSASFVFGAGLALVASALMALGLPGIRSAEDGAELHQG